jgi:hypothetical protein
MGVLTVLSPSAPLQIADVVVELVAVDVVNLLAFNEADECLCHKPMHALTRRAPIKTELHKLIPESAY